VIVTDRRILKELEPLWAKCFGFYHATLAPSPGNTMDEAQVAGLRRAATYQRDHFAEIPALLVACYTRIAPPKRLLREWRSYVKALAALGPRDALAITMGARRSLEMVEAASVYPAAQNMLLSARALGLGATLTSWPPQSKRRTSRSADGCSQKPTHRARRATRRGNRAPRQCLSPRSGQGAHRARLPPVLPTPPGYPWCTVDDSERIAKKVCPTIADALADMLLFDCYDDRHR
jgi:hypothetical protein